MGTDIHGWIEINTIKESMQDLWFRIIEIGIIGGRNYEVFSRLFGVRGSEETLALAPNRGMPSLTDSQAEIDTNHYNELVDKYLHSQSWINYQELASHLKEIPLSEHDWGWRFLFESMGKLAEHYGVQNVRMVVAFDS